MSKFGLGAVQRKMSNDFQITRIRKRKQRVYFLVLIAGLIVVGLVWLTADASKTFSKTDPVLLPAIAIAAILMIGLNLDLERLKWVEYGLFTMTVVPVFFSYADAMQQEPLDLVDLGDMFYWFGFAYFMGFLIFQAPWDWLAMGGYLSLTIAVGLFHYWMYPFSAQDMGEVLYLARFYISQLTMFAMAFLLFRLNETLTLIQVAKKTWEELALTDSLIGLSNRMALSAEIDRELAQVRRHNRVSSILMMDVDSFKSINDQFGHTRGDKVLVEIGKAITDNLREGDFAARYGGDEFVVLLPETNEAAAQKVGARIQQTVGEITVGKSLRVMMSVGVSELGAEMTGEDIFREVDERLYQAKGLR